MPRLDDSATERSAVHLATLAVHAGGAPDPGTGAVAPPIHLSTTFEHPADVALLDGYIYQRYSNPTQDRLETALAAIESPDAPAQALFFATGMAAVAAIIATLRPGQRVLLADDTYFAARTLMRVESERIGFRCQQVDFTDVDATQLAFAEPVNLVWAETPSNPLLKVTDIAHLARLARASGARLVVDATFATPVLLQPLALGADVVMHSATKYLAGHSDCMGGALVMRDEDFYRTLYEVRKLHGATASPFAAWLTLRGLRTLLPRLHWQCRSAHHVAQMLVPHPSVAKVHFPGLPDHPQHQVAKAQMRDAGAMLSFEVRADSASAARARAIAVAQRLKLFTNATSLGSVESLVEHRQSSEGPTSTTPAGLLRLSIGLEAVEDLIADLTQALEA